MFIISLFTQKKRENITVFSMWKKKENKISQPEPQAHKETLNKYNLNCNFKSKKANKV